MTEFIKHECLGSIGDSSPLIRATIGILITTVVARGGLENWPGLLQNLCVHLDSEDYNVCEVSGFLFCESSVDIRDEELLGGSWLTASYYCSLLHYICIYWCMCINTQKCHVLCGLFYGFFCDFWHDFKKYFVCCSVNFAILCLKFCHLYLGSIWRIAKDLRRLFGNAGFRCCSAAS